MHQDNLVHLSLLWRSKLCVNPAPSAALLLLGSLSDHLPFISFVSEWLDVDPHPPHMARILVSQALRLSQQPNLQSTTQCRFLLTKQISRARCSAVPGFHPVPLCFSSSCWWPGVGEGLGSHRIKALVHYFVLWGLLCSWGLYAVWFSLLSCCCFRVCCINYIFILFVVLGGVLCLTSHPTILNVLSYVNIFVENNMSHIKIKPTYLKRKKLGKNFLTILNILQMKSFGGFWSHSWKM